MSDNNLTRWYSLKETSQESHVFSLLFLVPFLLFFFLTVDGISVDTDDDDDYVHFLSFSYKILRGGGGILKQKVENVRNAYGNSSFLFTAENSIDCIISITD